jgi:hypothetical protein
MAKPRVHEVAKQLGVSTKEVMTELAQMGEFVRSASSTLEAPTVQRLSQRLADPGLANADSISKRVAVKLPLLAESPWLGQQFEWQMNNNRSNKSAANEQRLPTAHISSIRLQNVLSFGDARLAVNRQVTTLVGPNDVGKTNVFRALNAIFGEPNPAESLERIRNGGDRGVSERPAL